MKANHFYKLHQGADILVLPNAWDSVSARLFEQAGFPAIATTSAGIALAQGYSEPENISRDAMLQAIKSIVQAVTVPVTVDMEAGYASDPQGVAETVKMVIDVGAVGINLEDIIDNNLLAVDTQVERLHAARHASTELNAPFVINARTDIYLFDIGEPHEQFEQVVMRANQYFEAGADCVFIPGVGDPEIIAELVREIHGPINILANANVPAIRTLQQLGVKRVSTGSGPMRASLSLIRRIAGELMTSGTYEQFTVDTMSYAEANQLFSTD